MNTKESFWMACDSIEQLRAEYGPFQTRAEAEAEARKLGFGFLLRYEHIIDAANRYFVWSGASASINAFEHRGSAEGRLVEHDSGTQPTCVAQLARYCGNGAGVDFAGQRGIADPQSYSAAGCDIQDSIRTT